MGAAEYFKLIQDIRLDMLDLCGSSYVIEHCMAAFSVSQERKLYQSYVAECMRVITENTAGLSKQGKYITMRYMDIIKPQKEETQKDTRSAEEIIASIKSKLGRKEVKNDEPDGSICEDRM